MPSSRTKKRSDRPAAYPASRPVSTCSSSAQKRRLSTSSSRSKSNQTHFIPKGLNIGHDNWVCHRPLARAAVRTRETRLDAPKPAKTNSATLRLTTTMPSTRTKKQSNRQTNSLSSRRRSSGFSAGTTPDNQSSSSTSASSSPSSNSSQPPVIPKGLTIGHDNWADMTPKGLARLSFMQDANGYRESYHSKVNPNATDDEIIADWLLADWEKGFHRIKISAVHPKADDESVCYTVIPETPWGELSIRWWADPVRGYCFDLVDLGKRKIRAVPKDLQFCLWSSYGCSTGLETLEEGHRLANTGGLTSAVVKYTPNADGVVEERYAVPKRSRLGLCKRGSKVPIALIIGPGEDAEFSKDFGVPIYLPIMPT